VPLHSCVIISDLANAMHSGPPLILIIENATQI
jgi:hypothetical protein